MDIIKNKVNKSSLERIMKAYDKKSKFLKEVETYFSLPDTYSQLEQKPSFPCLVGAIGTFRVEDLPYTNLKEEEYRYEGVPKHLTVTEASTCCNQLCYVGMGEIRRLRLVKDIEFIPLEKFYDFKTMFEKFLVYDFSVKFDKRLDQDEQFYCNLRLNRAKKIKDLVLLHFDFNFGEFNSEGKCGEGKVFGYMNVALKYP